MQKEQKRSSNSANDISKNNDYGCSNDYVDFSSETGWRLERKFPSNISNYSDLLEDSDWQDKHYDQNISKHFRRDLDALS